MADPWLAFLHEVQALVEETVRPVAGDAPLDLETPPPDRGDLALPCFPLAKALRKAPAQIAADLATEVAKHLPRGLIAECRAEGPYLNFIADRPQVAAQVLDSITSDPDGFGRLPSKGKRMLLEHTSANPNGPLHVGRARNPILGDTLARIYRAAGWDVEVQYYVDDLGKQVALLAWGLANIPKETLEKAERDKADHRRVRAYQAAAARIKEDEKAAAEVQDWVQRSEEGEEVTLKRFHEAYAPVLEGMLASLKRIHVDFDQFVEESRFVQNGDTQRVIERLNATELARVEADGGRFLDLEDHGIHGKSQRFVYQRRDGTSLYATRDVAYHLWKAGQADALVNVLGEDHKLQAQQVRIALELLDAPKVPDVVFYAFVKLEEGKMSTRSNRVVFLDDLIDEAVARARTEVDRRRPDLSENERAKIAESVGVGALRYNIVRVQAEKGITFRWEEALNFEGASAPFVQYAYARCASLLRKASAQGVQAQASQPEPGPESDLVAFLGRLPRVVDEAARQARPHLVAVYAQELATALNAFYRDCPVLNAGDDAAVSRRLAIVAAAKTGLGQALTLLGLPTLEAM